jgi:hypothetical protein
MLLLLVPLHRFLHRLLIRPGDFFVALVAFHVSTWLTVPSAMILEMVAPPVVTKTAPEVVMAPTGFVPTFITRALVGSVVANAETAPSLVFPAVFRVSPAVFTALPEVTVNPVPAVIVVVAAIDDPAVIDPVTERPPVIASDPAALVRLNAVAEIAPTRVPR